MAVQDFYGGPYGGILDDREHDALCPCANPSMRQRTTRCICLLIADIRADERARMTIKETHC